MRTPHDILIRAMERGVEIEFPDGYTRTIIEGQLSLKMQVWKSPVNLDNPPDEERWMVDEMSFNNFIALCGEVPVEVIVTTSANLALTAYNQDWRRT